MSKVVLAMTMSLDGPIAGPGGHRGNGLGVGGEPLHAWLTHGGLSSGPHPPAPGVNAEVCDEMMAISRKSRDEVVRQRR